MPIKKPTAGISPAVGSFNPDTVSRPAQLTNATAGEPLLGQGQQHMTIRRSFHSFLCELSLRMRLIPQAARIARLRIFHKLHLSVKPPRDFH